MSNTFDDVSPGGSPIMVHSRQKDFTPPQGEEHIEAIGAHIERHLGPVSGVFHEIISDLVHIDVHVVPANDQFPHLRLVTSGMSDLPMTVPAEVDADAPRYMELMVTLPADWPISQDAFEDERNYWPVRLRSEEHTSELQSPVPNSYAVFCLKKKTKHLALCL